MTEQRSDVERDGEFRLREFLASAELSAEFVRPGLPMPTVSLAAAAVGVQEEMIIKSVLFEDRSGAVALAIACGTARIDRHRLSEITGLAKLKLADPETVLAATGFPVGGVSPIGHATTLPVVVDRRVTYLDFVFGGAGSEETLIKITPAEILRLAGGVVADITQQPKPTTCESPTSST